MSPSGGRRCSAVVAVAMTVLLWLALWLGQGLALPSLARAGEAPLPPNPADKPQMQPSLLQISAAPLFGSASVPQGGWTELLVTITNGGQAAAEGEVVVYGAHTRWGSTVGNESHAPYAVSVGATVSLRIPVRLGMAGDPLARVLDHQGRPLFEQGFTRNADNSTLLIDCAPASALGAALDNVTVGSRNDPWGRDFRGYSSPVGATSIRVARAMFDQATGDPLLPRRAAGYARVAAVLMPSDMLARLAAPELEALAGFVMQGGTLALVITRPEDMRHPTVTSFVGAEVRTATLGKPTTRSMTLSTPSGPSPRTFGSSKRQPTAGNPHAEIAASLTGYAGGNLRPSPYGSAATYGLGEVHLLAFNPQKRPAVDSPWVHVRMVDMLRRANERVSGTLFRHGGPHTVARDVRRQLDPNESARWAIVLAAFLLCLYACFAGPVNYFHWRKKHKPLRALIYLPLASLFTFGSVVVIGVFAKGCSGRARHLTMVEAGAGMRVGSARRWRGFFVPTQRKMTIVAGNASSVLGTESMDYGEESADHVMVEREGLRLMELPLRPWETLVVREDGYADLGDGIALVKKSASETEVVNRSGRRLRGLLLHQPGIGGLFLDSLDDGARASSTSFSSLSGLVGSGGKTAWGLPLRDFNVYSVLSKLNKASQGLGDAWVSVHDTVQAQKDWFPPDVPTLLVQIDGGESQSNDSGLRLDSDRMLVRVVGYGGAP
jgi:hypothetical protein